MTKLGIVEGFFGPEWTTQSRLDFASFLRKYGGSFYIYAPKRDIHLRKAWRDEWSSSYLNELRRLRDAYHEHSLEFGIALSPFGLGHQIGPQDWDHLKNKFKILSDLKLDYLGLFFDDMPSTDDLLKVQTEVVKLALEYFPKGLLFCPSYYSFDPILDKVFGQRPAGYVEGLKDMMPAEVEICWTGPKVISPEISAQHLDEVTKLLGRKPFIWENLFANDGPKNCKFLKLKLFTGRDSSLLKQTQGVGFNLMNQPYLSQLLFLTSLWTMEKQLSPLESFQQSCRELFSPILAQFLINHRLLFLDVGLDQITEAQKFSLLHELEAVEDPAAQEIRDWLSGLYLVGPECLTD